MFALVFAIAAQLAEPGQQGLVEEAIARLNKGHKADAILTDPKYDDVRADSRYRQAIADHAGRGTVSMVSPREPGDRLEFKMILRTAAGQPVKDAFVYVYHTDIKGVYFKGEEDGDPAEASRLFVYGRTGDDGTLTVKTIRPAGYPGTGTPQHIHFHVEKPSGFILNEVFFDDDPRLTKEMRSQSNAYASVIKTVKRNGVWFAQVELRQAR